MSAMCEHNNERRMSLWWTPSGWEIRGPVETVSLGFISVEAAIASFEVETARQMGLFLA